AIRASVGWPAPFSPRSACTLPAASSKSTPSRTVVEAKRLLIRDSRSIASGVLLGNCRCWLQPGGMVVEGRRQPEGLGEMICQRLHAHCLGGVMAGIDHIDAGFERVEGGVVRTLTGDEGVES